MSPETSSGRGKFRKAFSRGRHSNWAGLSELAITTEHVARKTPAKHAPEQAEENCSTHWGTSHLQQPENLVFSIQEQKARWEWLVEWGDRNFRAL